MKQHLLFKSFSLSMLFVKEQLKEPVALFWTVVSPVVTYYLIRYARGAVGVTNLESLEYVSNASWFYAYVSSSVAMFGLAFYMIGRRESGFLRSFVYVGRAKIIFVVGQFFAYSFISVLYCSVFYVITRTSSGHVSGAEYLVIVVRFYVCFLLFATPSLLLTLIPFGFQNASTVFSILSISMLGVGIVSVNSLSPLLAIVNFVNPMWWANRIMSVGVKECWFVVLVIIVFFVFSFFAVFRLLIINPVWSRY